MPHRPLDFYRGPYRIVAPLLVAGILIGGWLHPPLGIAVPVLMLGALAFESRGRRRFCASVCPNGRMLSTTLAQVSRRKLLPRFVSASGFKKGLCGFMLFCVANLLVRYGRGGAEAAGRIFWAVYLVAVSVGIAAGVAFKPRAFCAFCPMGTLQDTVGGALRSFTRPS